MPGCGRGWKESNSRARTAQKVETSNPFAMRLLSLDSFGHRRAGQLRLGVGRESCCCLDWAL
jgi:hypothetical protein